jgi:hypothetical protein
MKCKIENCDTEIHGRGLCKFHYMKWWRTGECEIEPQRQNALDGEGTRTTGGHILLTVDGRRVYEHVLIAEKALGKSLPKGAVVHHINGIPYDNRPENLVICPSKEYHALIHKRMKELGYEVD